MRLCIGCFVSQEERSVSLDVLMIVLVCILHVWVLELTLQGRKKLSSLIGHVGKAIR